MSDHYAVLGVQPDADHRTIQAAYRALARLHHPDFGGDAQEMVRINDAWRVLSDPERRTAYDARTRPRRPEQRRRDSSTVLDFGRYEGRSLAEIANEDDDYLAWLARTPLGRPLRAEIAELLEARRQAFQASRPHPLKQRRAWGLR